jgi:integrase
MRTAKLSEYVVSQLQPTTSRYEVWDTQLKGLKVRVGKSGKKVFYLWGRVKGADKSRAFQFSLGDTEIMTADKAREVAAQVLRDAKAGIHPTEAKREMLADLERKKEEKDRQQREADRKQKNYFEKIAHEYIEEYAKLEKNTYQDDINKLNLDWIPAFKGIPVEEITKPDIVAVLDRIGERGKRKTGKGFYSVNNNLALIRKVFNWAVEERGYIDRSPITRGMARGGKRIDRDKEARKRKYSDDELRALWIGVEKLETSGKPAPNKTAAIRLLTLTGQRAAVIGGLRWDEVDLENAIITIPANATGRNKASKEHIIPLSSTALEILEGIERPQGRVHVFSTGYHGDTNLYLGSKLKAEIREATGVDEYIHQHLRGILTTRMRLPLNVHRWLIDLIQGRFDKSVQGEHYDSNDYLDEKREALQTWDDYLMGIVNEADDTNVLPWREKEPA